MTLKYLLYIGAALFTLGQSVWVADSLERITSPQQREYIVTHAGW